MVVEVRDRSNFNIIGIGTSAGGLEALKIFIDNVPSDCIHSFVIIQHLSPDYKSLMKDLLAKNTTLPIFEVVDGVTIEAGSVYLIPPKKNMTIKDGKLHLMDKPQEHDLNLPIDIFFNSLALEKKENAIGIILTGTGSDGTRGFRTLKEEGGMLMVQSPETAKFDGMPYSAISTGLVDLVLPVEQLPGELLNFLDHPKGGTDTEMLVWNDEGSLMKILMHIKSCTDLDFTLYKRPTLVRRLARRLTICKCMTLKDYLNFLYETPQEVQIIYREFLIGVTRFFRDQNVWEQVENEIVPKLISQNSETKALKIWSIACSTGEEVYSIAIVIREVLEKANLKFNVKIFATDIDNESLEIAGKGIYPESIIADVSINRIQKYFVKKDDKYQIREEIRRMVIFSHHNIVSDPPLNKMDMIFCRNMLIYIQPIVQKKIMGYIHFSLNLNGYLVMGSSETVGDLSTVFVEIDRKNKIYRNSVQARSLGGDLLKYTDSNKQLSIKTPLGWHNSRKTNIQQKMTEALNLLLLEHLGITAVFVDDNYDIIHALGDFKKYIEFPDSGFSINLLKMVPDNVSAIIAASCRKSIQDTSVLIKKKATYFKGTTKFSLNIIVKPYLVEAVTGKFSYLITFLEESKVNVESSEIPMESIDILTANRILELEEELLESRENLQLTVEEVETSNEELQATNEELLASNEELQSTNEELQSVNEELHTVNAEHSFKIDELNSLNADIDNLFKSIEIGTVFLDNDLRIRKFTPEIKYHFNLLEKDIDCPIEIFSTYLSNANIKEDSLNVLRTGIHFEKEIQNNEGIWFLQRILPFIDNYGETKGVVISFVDITKTKIAELQYRNIFNLTALPLWEEDFSGVKKQIDAIKESGVEDFIEYAQENPEFISKCASLIRVGDLNPAAKKLMNIDTKAQNGFSFRDESMVACFTKELEVIFNGGGIYMSAQRKVTLNDGGSKVIIIYVKFPPATNNYRNIIVSAVDITELQIAKNDLEKVNNELKQFAYLATHDLRAPLTNLIGLTSLFEGDNLTEEDAFIFDKIKQSTTRLNETLDDLIKLITITKDELEEPFKINLVKEVEQTQEALQAILDLANGKVNVNLQVTEIVYIRSIIKSIVQNMMTNAVKYKDPSRSLVIDITSLQVDDFIVISFKDNGRGMDMTKHGNAIFKLYKRFDTDGEIEGKGIGLYIVKAQLERMGHSISVVSEEGVGTEFIIKLKNLK
ncbi:hypothetical protein FFWV33_08375 [Flavobacterium faecale]|uniref:histidine kinase n=1 Tax=Flavobacterium faecale TaxID=1355330 RepID=A0A2S1LCT5_9FLAO|nr:CheR family methyltransferase [Flavobacterium faecale]AWG21544.1 hypothetical protein FFWV33_08375 [Flavobacterium faecale]